MNFLRDYLIFLLICIEKYGKLDDILCLMFISLTWEKRIIELRFPPSHICITQRYNSSKSLLLSPDVIYLLEVFSHNK